MTNIKEKLRDTLLNIPNKPGIYKMIDKDKNIIYIGKSISLNKRVRSYFYKKQKWAKVKKLVPLINSIEYIVTDTHLEARILECEMIKTVKPIFNSQFKNDKRYVYLSIDNFNIHNPISVVYNYQPGVYGPFRKRHLVLKILDSLKNLYPILEREEGYSFNYKVLPIKMDKNTYNLNKQSLDDIFANDKKFILFLSALEKNMIEASNSLRFETAITYREIINNLNYLKGSLKEDKNLFLKKLFLNIPIDNGNKFYFVSRGKIILKQQFKDYNKDDVDSFIKKSSKIKTSFESPFEKSTLDFRDIIYSEIRSMPKEMIKIIH